VRILITAGPTREYLDDVRFLSNASSGKMGYALAAEAARRGHEVVVVSGPVELEPPAGVELVRVTSAQEMLDACLTRFEACDAAVMCAAVCDYRPARREPGKPPKHRGARRVTLEPTTDICATFGATKGGRILIGFALETHEGRARAEAKLRRKHCDAIVLNAPASIGTEAATIEVFTPGQGWSSPEVENKSQAAAHVLDLIERLV
jgi:phosphopantothenoylcysteine decarboxylase/phosphopantothenate--cysteine ligase